MVFMLCALSDSSFQTGLLLWAEWILPLIPEGGYLKAIQIVLRPGLSLYKNRVYRTV